jgi:uncharacterized protein with HEPN domain
VILEIENFTAEASEERLLAERALQLILEREFEVLGEAMGRLLRSAPEAEASIANARRIIGLRNLLAHGYDSIDHRILWAAVVNHLPQLKREIDQLLR